MSTADMNTVDCTTDYIQATRDKFGSSPYVIKVVFENANCSDFATGYGYPASGVCVGTYNESDMYYTSASLYKNGSASNGFYLDRSCLSSALDSIEIGDEEAVANHSCDANWFRWYSSNDVLEASGSSSALASNSGVSSSALSTGDILGISIGGFVFVLVFVMAFIIRRRRAKSLNSNKSNTSLRSMSATSLETSIRGQTGLWNDDIITAKRIPRDRVLIEKLISKGSFGEVYAAVYNGQKVAVKVLLPASRGNIQHVNEFLAEAKMTARWTIRTSSRSLALLGTHSLIFASCSNISTEVNCGHCLTSTPSPVGFDRQKATVALQVCHALTYLHSLMPSVIHRDFKSRNILFNSDIGAKLSDFGISRERLDRTMTAGVRTSWMAPEVMLGERYDDKADMFSFGVVLSELDLHTLPYARSRKENLDSNGREMTDSVLLQKVALGSLQVDFTHAKPKSIGELGLSCVSIDPTERPSAAEALYRLQLILSKRKIA